MLVEGPIMRAMAKAHAEEYLPRVKGKAGHGLGAPGSFLLTAAITTMLESCEEGFKAPLKELGQVQARVGGGTAHRGPLPH
eukprot:2636345-Pyramimonas_sp.AAC.1